MAELNTRIRRLQQAIRQLEQQHSRPEGAVRLLAVSKHHSAARIRQAALAGIRDFGENYLQEALAKQAALDEPGLRWHFIGPIQSNKTRGIAEHFDWVHSVARDKIAGRLNAQRPDSLPPLQVCVQVNLTNAAGKSGVPLPHTAALCRQLVRYPRLQLRGLMAIPEIHSGFAEQRRSFRQLGALLQQLQQEHPALDTLSMGMSNDFAAAIAEGATMVRIGTAIFGPRQ